LPNLTYIFHTTNADALLFNTGIQIMIEALFEKLHGALSENTLRAYRGDYNHFTTWCQEHDIEPLAHEPTAMLNYLTHMATQSSVATIVRRLASLSSLFKYLCLTDTTKNIDVCLTLKKIKRQKGTAQLQAEPLTKAHIEKMLPHCGTGIVRLRNQVLLHIGHQTMRRRSELCRFRFEDIIELPGKRYGILLRFSKTDQNGKGKTLPLTPEIFDLLMKWRETAGEGYILRGIYKGDNINQSLNSSSINKIIQAIQRKSNIKTRTPFSGHSFRVGGALDLLMACMYTAWHNQKAVTR
jgi:site-specific recombinase XerD